MKYYYADANNQAAGPLELSEIEQLISSAVLKSDPMVFPESGGEWKRLATVPEIAPSTVAAATIKGENLPNIESTPNKLPLHYNGRAREVASKTTRARTISAMDDADKMIRYEANKKSLLVGYLLLLLFGHFGAHRFYFGRKETAIAQLVITIISIPLIFVFFIGVISLIAIGIWNFVDLFLLPGICREYNNHIVDGLAYGAAMPV